MIMFVDVFWLFRQDLDFEKEMINRTHLRSGGPDVQVCLLPGWDPSVGRKNSSRFATSTSCTQGIGEERSGPKELINLRPTWLNLRRPPASRLQLGPNLGRFGCKLGLTCVTWSGVGAGTPIKAKKRWK